MRLGPKTIIHLGTGLNEIKPGLDFANVNMNDKKNAGVVFQQIGNELSKNDKYKVNVLNKDRIFRIDSSSETRIALGGFEIEHKETGLTMEFGVHFQKYNNGKYALAVIANTDLDEFSKEYNPESYKEHNIFLKDVVDDIYSTLENSSLMIMGSHESVDFTGEHGMNGSQIALMLEGTPYFKAKVPNEVIDDLTDYAKSNASNVKVEDSTVTVQRDPISQYDSSDNDHARNLFEVTQMLKGQKASI